MDRAAGGNHPGMPPGPRTTRRDLIGTVALVAAFLLIPLSGVAMCVIDDPSPAVEALVGGLAVLGLVAMVVGMVAMFGGLPVPGRPDGGRRSPT